MIAWRTQDDSYVNMVKAWGKCLPYSKDFRGLWSIPELWEDSTLPASPSTRGNICTRILALQVRSGVAGALTKAGRTVSRLIQVPLGTSPGFKDFPQQRRSQLSEAREE